MQVIMTLSDTLKRYVAKNFTQNLLEKKNE